MVLCEQYTKGNGLSQFVWCFFWNRQGDVPVQRLVVLSTLEIFQKLVSINRRVPNMCWFLTKKRPRMSNHTFAVVARLESFLQGMVGSDCTSCTWSSSKIIPNIYGFPTASGLEVFGRRPGGLGELVAHVMFLQVTNGLPRKDVDRLAWRSFHLRTCRQKRWICIDVFKRMNWIHPMVPTCPRHLSVSLWYLSILFQSSYQRENRREWSDSVTFD